MSQPYANLLGALKEGYFFKCGDRHKSWKLRWFVLTKDILYYFDKETSTEPLGIIPLKDYQRCKGMDGDAYQATGKQNSFFLQTPYRMYKAYCKDWKSSELWAESIAALGEFLQKKEDIRKPSKYQQEILRLTNDVICFASSLIHWFKLVVDSTPAYKNGIPSIYASAIYDTPRDLGAQSIELVRMALVCINAPNTPSHLENLKNQANTHKVKFSADLEVLRKAVRGMEEMRPTLPINEISDAAVTMCKTAFSLCSLYVKEEDVLNVTHSTYSVFGPQKPDSVPTSANTSSQQSAPPSITPSTLLQDYKALSKTIAGHMEVLKSRPMFPGEQALIQAVQTATTRLENSTTALVTALQQVVANTNQVAALYHDIPANCREIIGASEKVYAERS